MVKRVPPIHVQRQAWLPHGFVTRRLKNRSTDRNNPPTYTSTSQRSRVSGAGPMAFRGVFRLSLFLAALVAGGWLSVRAFADDPPQAEAAFLAENDKAMSKMMDGMAVKPSGDIDRDF